MPIPTPTTSSSRAVERGDETFQSSVDGVGWDRIVIEASGEGRWNGLSVQAIAEARSIEPVEACFDLLEEDPDTSCIGHAMDEGDVRTIMADPEVMVASDAIAMSPRGPLGVCRCTHATTARSPASSGRTYATGC